MERKGGGAEVMVGVRTFLTVHKEGKEEMSCLRNLPYGGL